MSTAMKLMLLVAAGLVASCHGEFDTSFASKLDEIKKTLDEAQQDGIASRHPMDTTDLEEDLRISSRLLMQAAVTPGYGSYGNSQNDTLPIGLTPTTARKVVFGAVMEGDWSQVQTQLTPFTTDMRTSIALAMSSTFYRGQVEVSNVTSGSVISTITLLLEPTVNQTTVDSYKAKMTENEKAIFTPLSKYSINPDNVTVTFLSDTGAVVPRGGAASVATASTTTILAAFGSLLLAGLLF